MEKNKETHKELDTIEIQEKNEFSIKDPNQDISLCLVMIVRDEEDTIEKCIRSVAPYISHWVIVDTGSKDKTLEVINKVTDDLDIPGKLYERPWVNFEVNRTESLELAKGICDYRWVIDADDFFVPEGESNPFVGMDRNADAYQILYKLDRIQYFRAQIVKSDQDWEYKGVLHEYLNLKGREATHKQIRGAFVKASISPLKRASSLKEKYSKDAEILEEALEKEPENTRYMFYLGQSYRDSGQIEKSIESYNKRAMMGGWEEEVYYSLYMVARLKEARQDDPVEVFNSYSKAWEYRPQRLEALFHTMRVLRNQNRHILAFTYGLMGLKSPPCNDILFLEKEIWEWRFLDEFSLAAYHSGNPDIAFKHLDPVVKADFFKGLSDNERNRMESNLKMFENRAEEKMKRIKEIKGDK